MRTDRIFVRVGPEQKDAWFEAAAADGFYHNGTVNFSGWVRTLADARVAQLGNAATAGRHERIDSSHSIRSG